MKKILLIFSLLLILCSFNIMPVEAHQTAKEHYEELEAMLFGSEPGECAKFKDSDELHILEYASTLCIDQFGKTGEKILGELRNYKVPGIPKSVSEINPPQDGSSKQLSSSNHRTYTHQGWNYCCYDHEEGGDLAHWEKRKNILLASVEKVFDFQTFSGKWLFINFGYSDKCNSFSALLYYNHLVGDYLEDTDPEHGGSAAKFNGTTNGHKIPFARTAENSEDIFSELKKHLEILFKDQEKSNTYQKLMTDIQTLASRARTISGNAKGTIEEADLDDMRACVVELMDILTGDNKSGKSHTDAIHKLLKEEKFFKDVFYKDTTGKE